MCLNMSSAKLHPFGPGGDELMASSEELRENMLEIIKLQNLTFSSARIQHQRFLSTFCPSSSSTMVTPSNVTMPYCGHRLVGRVADTASPSAFNWLNRWTRWTEENWKEVEI